MLSMSRAARQIFVIITIDESSKDIFKDKDILRDSLYPYHVTLRNMFDDLLPPVFTATGTIANLVKLSGQSWIKSIRQSTHYSATNDCNQELQDKIKNSKN